MRTVAIALALGAAITAGAMMVGNPWSEVNSAEAAVSAIERTSESVEAAQSSTDNVGRVLTANTGEQPATDSTEPEYKVQIDELYGRWEPAYERAMSDLDDFEESFAEAVAKVDGYLDEQRALTDSINDPILRMEQERYDRIEREAVQRWVANGGALSAEVANIKRELEDRHAILTKLSLRGEFLAENSALYQVPESAMQLHASLGSFKIESDRLATQLQQDIFSK